MRDVSYWRVEIVSGTDTPAHARGEIIDRAQCATYAAAAAFGAGLARPGDAVDVTLFYDTGSALLRAPVVDGALPEHFLDRWGRPDLPVPSARREEVRAMAPVPAAIVAPVAIAAHWHAPC